MIRPCCSYVAYSAGHCETRRWKLCSSPAVGIGTAGPAGRSNEGSVGEGAFESSSEGAYVGGGLARLDARFGSFGSFLSVALPAELENRRVC